MDSSTVSISPEASVTFFAAPVVYAMPTYMYAKETIPTTRMRKATRTSGKVTALEKRTLHCSEVRRR
jgi:hypothetical protein